MLLLGVVYYNFSFFVKQQKRITMSANGEISNKVKVVLGAQWGDEGKGKLVDLLAEHADVVARCQVSCFKFFICTAACCTVNHKLHFTNRK